MVTGVACGLQNRYGAFARPGWVRFPHVPATLRSRGVASVVGLLLALSGPAAGQEPPPPTPPAAEDSSAVVVQDSAALAIQDSAAVRQDTIPPISPLGALVRSMVVPGWGQAEVGRPVRGALYFGAASTTLFMVFKSSQKLGAAKRAEPRDEGLIDSRTRQRENWIVLTVFIGFLSGLDAWVSTNFWDFEPSILGPEDGAEGVGFGFRLAVP